MPMVMREKTQFARRCDKCHRPFKELYTINIADINYKLCSSFCIDSSRREYEKKKEDGLINTKQV